MNEHVTDDDYVGVDDEQLYKQNQQNMTNEDALTSYDACESKSSNHNLYSSDNENLWSLVLFLLLLHIELACAPYNYPMGESCVILLLF